MISPTLTTSALTSDIAANGASIADRVTGVVASHAAELATDAAIPAAKFAAVSFVRNRAKIVLFSLAVAVAVPILVKRFRDRGDGADEIIGSIPTMETR